MLEAGTSGILSYFGELTILVHPKYQNRKIGRSLFTKLLEHVTSSCPHILRVELLVRESNARAIELYASLGFKQEGRLENRIQSKPGKFEADIQMAWFNPNYKPILDQILM